MNKEEEAQWGCHVSPGTVLCPQWPPITGSSWKVFTWELQGLIGRSRSDLLLVLDGFQQPVTVLLCCLITMGFHTWLNTVHFSELFKRRPSLLAFSSSLVQNDQIVWFWFNHLDYYLMLPASWVLSKLLHGIWIRKGISTFLNSQK